MQSELRRAYAVLELSPPVSASLLKRQYRKLAKQWHPDRYSTDPIGRAEAARQMREVNDAYRMVEASLGTAFPTDPTPPATRRPDYSSSREGIEEVIAAINRSTSWSLWPRMSRSRWFSAATPFVYLLLAAALLPETAAGHFEVGRAVGRAFGYFLLPLFLIWSAEGEDKTRVSRIMFQSIGWVLMSVPALILLVLWLRGR